jgi:hypothetical protein
MMMLMGTRGSNHTNNKSKPSHDQLATSHPSPHLTEASCLGGGRGGQKGEGQVNRLHPLGQTISKNTEDHEQPMVHAIAHVK